MEKVTKNSVSAAADAAFVDAAEGISVQTVTFWLPNGELDPAGHRLHAAEPAAFLYSPTSHSVQGPSSGPVLPGLHHVVQLALPCTAFFPDGQDAQVSDDRAPNAEENVSSGHCAHAPSDAAPHEAEYVPAPHFVHSGAPPNEYLPASQS